MTAAISSDHARRTALQVSVSFFFIRIIKMEIFTSFVKELELRLSLNYVFGDANF
jgi:hypothetical protein